jgi:LmeA-like phospholipid-binding
MIDKVISTAVKLWLRSQIQQNENLQVTIAGSNRQILRGYLTRVYLICSQAVYRGLHLSQIELTATNIAFNVTEVVKKRQPLQLLEPISVDLVVLLTAADLQASVASSILSDGLTDFFLNWIATSKIASSQPNLDNLSINWSLMAIAEGKLNLQGTLIDATGKTIKLEINSGLTLSDRHTLLLSPWQIITTPEFPVNFEDCLKIDLGRSVAIAELAIQSDKIWCSGKITVFP